MSCCSPRLGILHSVVSFTTTRYSVWKPDFFPITMSCRSPRLGIPRGRPSFLQSHTISVMLCDTKIYCVNKGKNYTMNNNQYIRTQQHTIPRNVHFTCTRTCSENTSVMNFWDNSTTSRLDHCQGF